MSAKATVKSPRWSCSGRAPSTCKRRARARSRIPATSPWTPRALAGRRARFYVICEADKSFRAVPAGHGSGRNLPGANFANGIQCAKNFSNAMDSKLTTGGPYVTDETITSFKGYYRGSAGKYVPFSRSFVQFEGEGDTANAGPRAIGGHPAVLLRGVCLRKMPDSPYANTGGLRSVWNAGELRWRPQQRLHQLVGVGRRANHPDDEGAVDALHLSRVARHRRHRASGEGRQVVVARGAILERLLPEADRRRRNSGRRKPSSRSSLSTRRIIRHRRRSRRRSARGSDTRRPMWHVGQPARPHDVKGRCSCHRRSNSAGRAYRSRWLCATAARTGRHNLRRT